MQLIHVLCPREQTFPLAQEFEEQFAGNDALAVAASGFVAKQPVGFVVLTASPAFDEKFLAELNEHPEIAGYCVFSLNDDEVFPFGCELVRPW